MRLCNLNILQLKSIVCDNTEDPGIFFLPFIKERKSNAFRKMKLLVAMSYKVCFCALQGRCGGILGVIRSHAVPLLREHVGESWCGGTDCLLISGIRSYRLYACSLGKLTGPIFDCPETAVGLCPWPRTVCESVGERWSDEAGCLLTSGIRSYRGLHACWRGWSMGPIFDCRETEWRESSRWIPRRRCVCLGVCARYSIDLNVKAKCGKERDVATVGWLPSEVECRRLRQLLLHV
jgi:hypothetical protein